MEEQQQQQQLLGDGDGGDDHLEKGLLLPSSSSQSQSQSQSQGQEEEEDEDEQVLYCADSLQGQETEAEDKYIKLKTTQWILYSLLLILAWGFGFLMLLYTPIRRYILRRTIRSRQLYLTPHSIVYKITKPLPFPCFGVFKKHKHVLLASVSDVVIDQGYLQSRYGVYSIRIEHLGVTRPPTDHLQIEGIANPQAFRKAVLMRLLALRNEAFSTQTSILEHAAASSTNVHSPMSPLKPLTHDTLSPVGEFAILQKLHEVATSLKRLQSLFEEQQPKKSVCID